MVFPIPILISFLFLIYIITLINLSLKNCPILFSHILNACNAFIIMNYYNDMYI